MIKIIIADDHKMFVDGIESILKSVDGYEVVGRCYNGEEVFSLIKDTQPDVLLLDVNLPGISGIDVSKQLKKEKSNVKILAISMFNEKSFITEILNNGALGYILKNTGKPELLKAIKSVSNGESFFSKSVTETIMNGLVRKKGSQKLMAAPRISRRENEVLQLIAQEYTTNEIAKKLFISLKTVETHRSNLLSKLKARNSVGLVKLAIEHGLINNDI